MEKRVYADLTFLINFTMDFLILWATASMANIPVIWSRIISGSFLGAAYAVFYLIYADFFLFSLPGKIIFSAVFVVIVMRPHDWQQFKRVFFYFYAVSFTMAGASLAVSYVLHYQSASLSFPYVALLGGVATAIFIIHQAEQYVSDHVLPALLNYQVELHFGQEVCRAKGFLDTGNGLKDPLSQRPVLVAEYEVLKDCLPNDFCAAFEKYQNENELLENLGQSSWAHRLRLIPFSSIGKKNGLLIGIRSDEVCLQSGQRSIACKNMVVGIYREKLSQSGAYQLLIPSDVLTKM